jgi:hypothetical protein
MVNKLASACLATFLIAVLGLTTSRQVYPQEEYPPEYRYFGKDGKIHEGTPPGKPGSGYTRNMGEWVKQPRTKSECIKRGKIDPGPDGPAHPMWVWKNGKCLSDCPEGECG